jgi:hypothetical protein
MISSSEQESIWPGNNGISMGHHLIEHIPIQMGKQQPRLWSEPFDNEPILNLTGALLLSSKNI